MKQISSTQNPLVKRLISLRKKTERQHQGSFVVEGLRAISGFMDHGWEARSLLLRDDRECPLDWRYQEAFQVSAAVLQKISNHKQEPGFLAEFSLPVPVPLDKDLGGLLLFQIADPGNAGTLIRSAAAFGWKQVVLLGSVDPYAPKVVQATVGALAGVDLFICDDLDELEVDDGAPLAALVLHGGENPQSMSKRSRWLVIGSEAHGLSDEMLQRCSEQISIPMASQVESLNAAVAGSIAACCLGKL